MGRVIFPAGFQWGAATSSYQIEGAARDDGKGESIWDRFARTPGRIDRGETGERACEHYHRMPADVALMREIGLTSYRFSIAWPRIQPDGRGKPNAKGLDFYSRLVDALLEAGIRPLPTLYHWDLPQALEDRGGWPQRDLAGWFADYAAIAAHALGDRAPDWIVFNEPWIFTVLGYLLGIHAPGRRDFDAFARASHTVALAQGEAFRAMKDTRSGLRIGTAFSMSPCEPAGDSDQDAAAAERYHRFANCWFLEPALRGRYPEAFPAGVPERAMDVREGDMQRCRAPLDFIGINLYTRTRVRHAPESSWLEALPAAGPPVGPVTEMGWEVWPQALHDMVLRISRDYSTNGRPPEIEITENGCAYGDGPDPNTGRVSDPRRIEYYEGHLAALARAMEAGADVRGYHAWSLLDNFEWSFGYARRFGLVHVDFETQTRTLKDSARWYARVIDAGGFAT